MLVRVDCVRLQIAGDVTRVPEISNTIQCEGVRSQCEIFHVSVYIFRYTEYYNDSAPVRRADAVGWRHLRQVADGTRGDGDCRGRTRDLAGEEGKADDPDKHEHDCEDATESAGGGGGGERRRRREVGGVGVCVGGAGREVRGGAIRTKVKALS